MIFDTLENCEKYCKIHNDFEKAFDFIKKAVRENLPSGKYEIDSSRVYASIQKYTTKSAEEGKFEGHRKYIDIQYMMSGTEAIECVDVSKAESLTGYNEEKDCEFFENKGKSVKGVIDTGDYAVFFPNDLHKPSMSYENVPANVKKIVVKVQVG